MGYDKRHNLLTNSLLPMIKVETFKIEYCDRWIGEQFEAYRYNGLPVADKVIPRPYVYIVFHFGDCPIIEGFNSFHLEQVFLAPLVPQAINLKFHGNMDTLVITCKASVFSRLFNIDMTPVKKRSITLPEHIFLPLWEKMSILNSTAERMNCFFNFINSFQQSAYIPDAIDLFYDKIIEKSISTPLKEIMQECCESKSSILRKFIKRTGVNPKTMARLVRFNYLWGKIRDEKVTDFQELVFYGNYFDQAHLIKDFKHITGETPSYFFKRNLDIVKAFSGIPTQSAD